MNVILALLTLVSRRGKVSHTGNTDSSFNESISHSTSLSTDHATARREATMYFTSADTPRGTHRNLTAVTVADNPEGQQLLQKVFWNTFNIIG
jgi:hypothetical protein